MIEIELFFWRHVDYLGRWRTTRHRMTRQEAAKQLGPEAEPVPSSREVRQQCETQEELYARCPGIGFGGPGTSADLERALAESQAQRPISES